MGGSNLVVCCQGDKVIWFFHWRRLLKEAAVALSSGYSNSGLDVWFKDDIKNTLRGVDSANAELFETINTPEMQLYRKGYEAAIRAIAEAFGIRYKSSDRRYEKTPTIIDVTPLG
jgi:hypothetical protein